MVCPQMSKPWIMYLLVRIAAYHYTNHDLMYDLASYDFLLAVIKSKARVTADTFYKGHHIPAILLSEMDLTWVKRREV